MENLDRINPLFIELKKKMFQIFYDFSDIYHNEIQIS